MSAKNVIRLATSASTDKIHKLQMSFGANQHRLNYRMHIQLNSLEFIFGSSEILLSAQIHPQIQIQTHTHPCTHTYSLPF